MRLHFHFMALWVPLVGFILASLFLAPSAYALVSAQQIQYQLDRVSGDGAFPEGRKKALTDQLRRLLDDLQEMSKLEEQEREYQKLLDTLPSKTESMLAQRKKLERNPLQPVLHDGGQSIDDMEQTVGRQTNRLAAQTSELESLQQQYQEEIDRPAAIHSELQALNAAQEEEPGSVVLWSGGGEEVERLIKTWTPEVRQRLIDAKRLALEKELQSHQFQMDWLRAQIAVKSLLTEAASQELRLNSDRLAQMRSQDAESYRRQSLEDKKKLDTLHPVLKQLAQANLVLSEELAETTQKIADVVNYTAEINGRMAGLSRDFERTRKKIEVAGLSQALGQVLLEERRRLLGIAYTDTQNLVNQEKIAQVGLRQIQNEEERQSLANSRTFIAEQISGLVQEEAAAIIDSLRELADKRRALLDRVVTADQNYLQALSDLDFSLRQMRDSAESYRNFITERLLWIRSSQGLNTTMTLNIPQQVLALVSSEAFDQLVVDLQTLAKKYWPGMLLGTFCLLLLFWERRNLRESLRRCAVPLKRLTTDNFLVTIKAVCISLLLAAPLSIVLIFLGFTLQKTDGLGKLASALGPAAWDIGRYLLLLQLLRQLSKRDGVFRAHFKWKDDTVTRWFTGFNKLLYLFLPALFLSLFLINFDFGSVSEGLAHVSFTISMVILAHCLVFFLSDSKATTYSVAEPPLQGESGLPKSGRLTRFLFVLVPVCLALFGLAGYLYTASTLCLRILDSISLVVVLVAAHQLVLRWLLLAERKLAYQNALERRAAMRQKASETQEEILGEEAQIEIEEPKIDLEAVSKGGKELLRTIFAICGALGIWFIWAEILPAFGILDRFALWRYTETIAGQDVQVPVTIFDLSLSLFIVAVTVLAAKRVPALIEFILLQRLSLSAGALYTVKTLSGYVIVAIGMVLTFGRVGASWSQIQWLVAALSVGIGFGLQEIVANFISGLIILFERPIRVGDVVTVGDVDGVVTRINIRATTIRNWDQKELLVPNKEFITGRLLNWTLSDQTTRIRFLVGVAYGSDVERAIAIALDVVKSHPNVMTDPAPSVFFESFGDNSLVLVLRGYVAKLEHRLPTISEIQILIYKRFSEAGIAIAFPQRDVHLDTSRPLEIKILDATAPPGVVNP